ncbi:MAG: CpsB/CapC family capsule biosynthesis tyrosine phosphatase, partial [Pseudomonadota bacterium]
ERYQAIQQQPQRAEALGRSAALVVDLAALDGAHGAPEMRTARRLLQDGLVHAVATDIHRPEDAPAIAAGMVWIRKHLGPSALDTLLDENPRRILAGDLPDPLT